METHLNGRNREVDIKDSDIVIVFVTTVGKHFVNLLPTVPWKSDCLLTKIEVLVWKKKKKRKKKNTKIFWYILAYSCCSL